MTYPIVRFLLLRRTSHSVKQKLQFYVPDLLPAWTLGDNY